MPTAAIKVYNYCNNRPDALIGDFFVNDKDSQDRHLKNFFLDDEVLSDPVRENAASFFEWVQEQMSICVQEKMSVKFQEKISSKVEE